MLGSDKSLTFLKGLPHKQWFEGIAVYFVLFKLQLSGLLRRAVVTS